MSINKLAKKLVGAVTTATLALSLLGCSSVGTVFDSLDPSNSSSASELSPSASASPTPTISYVVAPLTGVKYIAGKNTYLTGPVVMGKVDNSFGARPQAGLSQTDVVYEELVEGGITRYLAIWHSKMPKQFGPIRSVRPMDPDIATPYGGVIAYSGGQKPFVTAMKKTGLYNASETSEVGRRTMKRVKDRVAPHNLFVMAQRLARKERKYKAPKAQLQFATVPSPLYAPKPTPTPTPTESASASPSASATPTSVWTAGMNSAWQGKSVKKVIAKFPQTTAMWTWDKKTKKWLRTQDGTKTIDAMNKKRVSADNVFVLVVKIDHSFKDPRYGNVPKTVFEGRGKGMFFSEGHGIKITWAKKSQKSAAVFKDGKGRVLKVSTGNTWFEMVPSDSGSYRVSY